MSEIVFVHGIANEQLSADLLESGWRAQLAGGLRSAGRHDLADRVSRDRSLPGAIDCRMAFYGNLFLRRGAQGVEPFPETSDDSEVAELLALEWLANVAERARTAEDREEAARALAATDIARQGAQGKGAVARVVFNALARVPFFAEVAFGTAATFVEQALSQVTRYLRDPHIRPTAQRTVLDLLGPETRVLIAHSLGSVVAYEALNYAENRVRLFVTIGSPLGMGRIVYPNIWPQPPTFPRLVDRWVNIADREDFIACDRNLDPLFGNTGRIEGAWTVDNGASPHDAQFYLGKKEIGEAIATALH